MVLSRLATECNALSRSGPWEGLKIKGGDNLSPQDEIGLTDLSKVRGTMAPPAPIGLKVTGVIMFPMKETRYAKHCCKANVNILSKIDKCQCQLFPLFSIRLEYLDQGNKTKEYQKR